MRVVSLLPSATEIVAALGHGHELVARSSECDFPPEVHALPVAMRPRTEDADKPSREIDARVRAERGQGRSLYELDVALLARTRPDVIFTQELCGVCSVTGEETLAACRAAGIDPQVVSLTPRRLEEVRSSITVVGAALDDAAAAERLVGALHRRELGTGSVAPRRPTVAVVEWIDPPILAGLWVPDLLEGAGAHGLPGLSPAPGEPGVRTTWEEIARARPDAVVLSPCSFSVPRTLAELDAPGTRPFSGGGPFSEMWVADEAYFSRPGPRLWDGLDLLRSIVREEPPSSPWPFVRRAPEVAPAVP
jgi:iron complex transport system substrate-binding protein